MPEAICTITTDNGAPNLRVRLGPQLHRDCDKEVDALIDRQSSEPDPEKRRQLV